MPCSCKAHKTIEYKQPASEVIYTTKPKVQYDFSSTTSPVQYCQMCIIKHLSMVPSLLQFRNPLSYLVAASQLFLVFKHLYEKDQQKAVYFYYKAMEMLQNPDMEVPFDVQKLITEYTENNALEVDKDLPQHRIAEDHKQYLGITDALLALAGAYSLMFTQPTYEKINRIYAIGDLSTATQTFLREAFPVEVFEGIRQSWKLLQEVNGQYTQDYFKAKEHMQNLLSIAYKQYLKRLREKQPQQ